MWHIRNEHRQPNDLYATRPRDIELLYKYEPTIIEGKIWECACGHGHIVNTLHDLGATHVYASDLIDYGFGYDIYDFLSDDDEHTGEFDTILTNPPYKHSTEFIAKALSKVKDNGRVIMLLPTLTLSGITRFKKIFYRNPPKYVYIFAKNTYGLLVGDDTNKYQLDNVSHSWFIWEKGFKGDTIMRWLYDETDTHINPRRKKPPKSPKPRLPKTDGLPAGVRKRGSTYEVRIKVSGRYIHIGRYTTKEDAILARKQAEIQYRGEQI